MIEAIIFDFDGVIFDSEYLHFEACNHVFRQFNITLDYDDYLDKYVGLSDKEMFPMILIENHIQLNSSQTNQLINSKIEKYYDIVMTKENLQSVSGIHDFLGLVSDNSLKVAICSGSERKELDVVLNKIDQGKLIKHFKTIITANDVRIGKPSPEGYLLTAKQLQVTPEKCLVIEDTPNGIRAAKSANMKVIALLTTNPRDRLLQADQIVKNFLQLSMEQISGLK